MALPGMRGYGSTSANAGRRNIARTNNSTGVISAIHGQGPESAKPRIRSAIQNGGQSNGSYDPTLGRRIDSLELRMAGNDQANRALLEQLMRLNQDMKMELNKRDQMYMEEKNQRMRIETALQVISAKMNDNEDRLKKAEDAGRESKNALVQLITHTKNVERAITMNQQDVQIKKDIEAQKLLDIQQKISTLSSARENVERQCYNLRDEMSDILNKLDNVTMEVKDVQGAQQVYSKMLEAQSLQLKQGQDGEKETIKLSESVKSALEASIAQLQQLIMESQSKTNQERKEREADVHILNQRVSDCAAEIGDIRRTRNSDLKDLQDTCKKLVDSTETERQRVSVQISAVQTDILRTIDERDLKVRQSTVHRIDELEKEISLESKARLETEKDLKVEIEGSSTKIRLYTDETIGALRQMLKAELETLRTRIQEVNEFTNELDLQVDELRSEQSQLLTRSDGELNAKIKICEARIEDIGDRLRLGMGKMQAAVGESKSTKSGRGTPSLQVNENPQLREEQLAGIREQIAIEVGKLEEDIAIIKSDLIRQEDTIEQRLKVHMQQGEDASTILGDKLQQKMDAVTFIQERMRRQIEDLQDKQDKVRGAPMDISDMRDRMLDIEQNFKKSNRANEGVFERIDKIENDVNNILGRSVASNATGTPSIMSLQNNLDETNSKLKKVILDFEDHRDKSVENLEDLSKKTETNFGDIRKELVKQEKRTIALKERLKKSGPAIARRGPDDDEVFEDEKNE